MDIHNVFNDIGEMAFPASEPNKNAVSQQFPDFVKTEIQNSGWIWAGSDTRVDPSPVILCAGDRPVRNRPPLSEPGVLDGKRTSNRYSLILPPCPHDGQ